MVGRGRVDELQKRDHLLRREEEACLSVVAEFRLDLHLVAVMLEDVVLKPPVGRRWVVQREARQLLAAAHGRRKRSNVAHLQDCAAPREVRPRRLRHEEELCHRMMVLRDEETGQRVGIVLAEVILDGGNAARRRNDALRRPEARLDDVAGEVA